MTDYTERARARYTKRSRQILPHTGYVVGAEWTGEKRRQITIALTAARKEGALEMRERAATECKRQRKSMARLNSEYDKGLADACEACATEIRAIEP